MITVSEILSGKGMTNMTAFDYDNDNRTNLEEVRSNTDPCSDDSTF